ncbi:unnamed protein product [Linum tenue]|uniref:Uncharacterized protein n=1 Tax=Linum tenue TaxID=586396 RepID=A0AAV0L8Z1_9ROSI|nr:unnamed protein product [Linum tenue]
MKQETKKHMNIPTARHNLGPIMHINTNNILVDITRNMDMKLMGTCDQTPRSLLSIAWAPAYASECRGMRIEEKKDPRDRITQTEDSHNHHCLCLMDLTTEPGENERAL